MASVPLISSQVEAAPKDYSVPGSQVIRLLSARASFDGSGAASAWCPALQLLDNNGNVLVTFADKEVTVAAGSDADVSWFPRVTAGGTATASNGAEWFYASHPARFTTGGLTTANIPWTAHQTSDATLFSITNDHGANTTVSIARPGVMFASVAATSNEVVDFTWALYLASTTDFFIGTDANSPMNSTTVALAPQGTAIRLTDYAIGLPLSTPSEFFAKFENDDGSTRGINGISLGILWFSNPTIGV